MLFPAGLLFTGLCRKCENHVSGCTRLHNKDISLCLRIISGFLQQKNKKTQISNRKYGGSCCNTKHHGRHCRTARTAGALDGTHRKSLIVREEKEKLSIHQITISNSFPRIEDKCTAKSSLPVQGRCSNGETGVFVRFSILRFKNLSKNTLALKLYQFFLLLAVFLMAVMCKS